MAENCASDATDHLRSRPQMRRVALKPTLQSRTGVSWAHQLPSSGLDPRIDRCQYRCMSKSMPLADTTVRCSPLVREPLSEQLSADLASVFKALADPVRLRLLSLIASHQNGEACVCDISPTVDVTQPTISHHLKVLKAAGLLESERRASWVYYRVVPGALSSISQFLQAVDSTAAAQTESAR